MDERTDQPPNRRALLQRLESLQRSGVRQIAKPRGPIIQNSTKSPNLGAPILNASATSARDVVAADLRAPVVSVVTQTKPSVEPMPTDANSERRMALQIIQQQVVQCRKCTELADTRTQTVFGVGNPHARLCFLGEAPGADEDKQGEPFVGRAGKMLNDIIQACTLKREDVYILNILKCRPPGNRAPTPDEAHNCSGFLHRQLEIIQPEYICCLGSVAATNLLDTTLPIGKLRGKFHLYRGIKVLATYHPAYLLRNPSAKRQVWDDMKLLMQEMGIEIRK